MTNDHYDQREDIHALRSTTETVQVNRDVRVGDVISRADIDRFIEIEGTVRAVNTTGINPIEFKVLIAPKPVEEVTKGGVYLAPSTTESEKYATVEGTIVARSPLAFTYARQDEWDEVGATKPKAGDRVIYAKYAGVRLKGRDGQDYLLVNDKDICATIEE